MNSPRPALPLLRRTRTLRLPPGLDTAAFTLAVLVLLLGLEAAARLAVSDAGEAVVLGGLLLLGILVRLRHARRALPWVEALLRLRRRVEDAFRRQALSVGIDLRGAPPLPPAFPPILGGGVIALGAATVLLGAIPSLDAAALRAAVGSVSAVAWVALLGAGWALCLAGGLFLLFLAIAVVHDGLVRSHDGPGPRPMGREAAAVAGGAGLLLAAWLLLPPWTPLLLHAGCLAAALAALAGPGGPDAPLLWKRRSAPGAVCSVSLRMHTLAGTATVALLLADALLLVRGEPGGRVHATLPITTGLVHAFSWCCGAGLLAWTWLVAGSAVQARGFDPARPCRPETAATAADRAAGGTAAWLRRRGEIRCRRRLVRGLEGLFRRAARRRFRQGSGFWVAPWQWFCTGLTRDEDERDMDWRDGTLLMETIGPSYRRVFPRTVLHHAGEVMRGLQIDLIFVEDGVGFRRLRRVLRMAFELDDILGRRGRAEEHHFTGLPGVRVVIHDFDMDGTARHGRTGYPEPDYESVGRARILHVFRDRGESESPAGAPRDRSGVPVPA